MMFGSRRDKNGSRDYRQASLYLAIPAVMVAAPIIGFLIGHWLDGAFNTEPYLTTIGAVLGIAAAGLETYTLIKKASALDKDTDDDSTPRT